MIEQDIDVWLPHVKRIESSHYDQRETDDISLLVIHNISLPPAEQEVDFDNEYVEAFFTGRLDHSKHSYFEEIIGLRVSSHLYIKRDGSVIQFVPLNGRAWHAGLSEFNGQSKCNDFSIGIELQGTDYMEFTGEQYESLVKVTKQIQQKYPKITKETIKGHSDIAPGRKTDPGPKFDWQEYFCKL